MDIQNDSGLADRQLFGTIRPVPKRSLSGGSAAVLIEFDVLLK